MCTPTVRSCLFFFSSRRRHTRFDCVEFRRVLFRSRHRIERDNRGNIIREYNEIIMDEENPRIDGWFLCIAPLERPTLAMAVVVEGGGYGSRSAAQIGRASCRERVKV